MRLRLFALLVLALLAFAAVEIWLPVQPAGIVDVHIPAGVSGREIGHRLQQAGVIRSPLVFRILSEVSGASASLQSGYYRFASVANVWQVLQRMQSGDAILYRITIPEGLRTDEVLTLLAKGTETDESIWFAALNKLLDKGEQQGRLLPETYTYRKPARPEIILAEMIKAQESVIQEVSPTWIDAKSLRIVASIVEKETAMAGERPQVAAVIRNRLAKHMALQMDPTVIYGLWKEDGVFSGNLHKADMRRDTPWNTYTRKGLPPTPICNPGKASLMAAAHPADVDYLYFVANGTGGHAFAADLQQHERNVRRWLKIERRRHRP